MKKVWARMREEQAAEFLPPDVSGITRLRWEMLHGAKFTAAEVTARFGMSSTSLSMLGADLERAGFVLEREVLPDRQKRLWITNLDHVPQPFTSRKAKKQRAVKNIPIAVPKATGFKTSEIRDQLIAAYPDAVTFGANVHSLHTAISQLRHRHRLDVARVTNAAPGTYRLVSMPETTGIAVEKVKTDRITHDGGSELHHFHRPPPAVLPLGTVVRVVMVAEDNGHAAVVLKDMAGHQWFAHVDTPA